MNGNSITLTYVSFYHPHTQYAINQPLYSGFQIAVTPLVKLGSTLIDDIKSNTKSGT
jgi:hypothetical protein